ncbi:hypothetical protein [Chryseobacterium sp. c4a]|uniref:hypothetical protein n=1 Tax=Chryseobacterium sp. c4a TaxID=1573582 RepID=UPI00135AC7B1|nr:hypothetical protein [Chryseobacterium sp. c4a]
MSKLIIVPKDKEAEIALDYDTATPEQVVELNLTDEEFEKLWEEGVFSLINEITNSNIDDFEDEHITDLNDILNAYVELQKTSNGVADLIKMFELAITYKTSIHFYF